MDTNSSRGNKFIKDLGIYAIGNLGSKLITFLLVPFYTHYITNTAEYGIYELAMTISFCFIPIICLQMNDGGFRFLIETNDVDRHRAILSYITKTLITNSLIIILLATLFGILHPINFMGYIVAFGIMQTFYEVCIQVIRGLGKTKLFMLAGLINAALTAIFSIIFLAFFGWGVYGIFIALIAARVIILLYLNFKIRLTQNYISHRFLDKSTSKDLLKYSLPLIPVALCWWFVSANNQFFIERYLGLTDTGYYGLVCRFTGILYILCNIYYQTWQQNAIEQYNAPDRNQFFSNIFNNYYYLLCFLACILPYLIRINYGWLVGKEFQESSQYLFLNSIYTVMFALAAFFEIGYQCAKRTARILPSLIMAIGINLLCNVLLIKSLGVNGVIISSIITYLALLVYRVIDTRKFIQISFFKHNIIPTIVIILGGILYYFTQSFWSNLTIILFLTISFVYFAPGTLKTIFLAKLNRKNRI